MTTPRPPDAPRDWLERLLEEMLQIEMVEDLDAPAAPASNYWCCGHCHPWLCETCQEYHCAWFDDRCPRKSDAGTPPTDTRR